MRRVLPFIPIIVLVALGRIARAEDDRIYREAMERRETREREIDDLYTVWSLDAHRERRGMR